MKVREDPRGFHVDFEGLAAREVADVDALTLLALDAVRGILRAEAPPERPQ